MWAIDNISNYSANATLRDGTPVRVRAIRPNDKERLARHFDGLGCDSRYHRFFGIKNGLTPCELRYFTEPDFLRHVALVVTVINRDGQETIVSDGRYVALPGCRSMAELALSVVDTHQRKGIGTLLLECLIDLAQHLRLDRLEADILASNRGAVRFLIRRGFKSTLTSGGVCHVPLSVEDHHGNPSIDEGHPSPDAVGRLHISRLCHAVHRHGKELMDWRAAEDELQVVSGLRTANDRKVFYDRCTLREIEHAHTNWQR
jgi:GNAT superfamily N-acetyltransferase